MTLGNLFRGRLALRIYLVGLLQFAVIAVGMGILFEMTRDKDRAGNPHEAEVRFVHHMVEVALGQPQLLENVLAKALKELEATVTVFDPDGKVVATNASSGIPPCIPAQIDRHGPPEPEGCYVKQALWVDGRMGRIEQINRSPLPPRNSGLYVIVLVLCVVGISSWGLARTLTRPLRQLSNAARAFGTGDLKARARLSKSDELGDVSRAFDEMADHVTNLLRTERELLANVSHELRTPLSRIRMALALVAESEGDVAIAREMLGEIEEDLDELERLITDVLAAARLDFEEAGMPTSIPPLRRQTVDLHSLINHAVVRFETLHPTRSLRVDLSSQSPVVNADPVLLRRVFDNLLENAHKYTEDPTAPIDLVARCGEDITVEVIDHGIGITPEDLQWVFRPFYRADKSRTRATGGLGLGLSLAKRIVDAHGGTIELGSKFNEGTWARVRLPIAGKIEQ